MNSERNSRLPLGLLTALIPVAAVVVWLLFLRTAATPEERFIEVMNAGKNHYEAGDAAKAIQSFIEAVQNNPTSADAHLNLANGYLAANQNENAIRHADEVLKLDPQSAAAYYVKGVAHLRLNQFEQAVQALQNSTQLDPSVAAAYYQLGLAHQGLKQWDEAISAFQLAAELEPKHRAAHYNLSQVLVRAGRPEEAKQELALHQEISSAQTGAPPTAATYERSIHTQPRVPFRLQQPEAQGVKVTFTHATAQAFAKTAAAAQFRGPIALVDVRNDGHPDLFVAEGTNGFRLLVNTNGVFQPNGDLLPGSPGATYTKALAGDLNRDRYEDVIVLGPQATHVFKFATNGAISEVSPFTRLHEVRALDGLLLDLDFSGNLDLIAVSVTNTVRVFRNLGNLLFRDTTSTSGVPANVTSIQRVNMDDWNNDDLMDLFFTRPGQPPLMLAKQRGGPLVETNYLPNLPPAQALGLADLNNDLRADLVIASGGKLICHFGGLNNPQSLATDQSEIREIQFIDYDNDGWLDLFSIGAGLRAWRNLGLSGFKEITQTLGLDRLQGQVRHLAAADFDSDCDTDLLADIDGSGLQFWRNDGGNANYQVKARLFGNRSNTSGIGVRIELAAVNAGWRAIRTVHQLPIEIGIGKNKQLSSVNVRWFDLAVPQVDTDVGDGCAPMVLFEPILPSGSCPYLYVWDGDRFRFVTDLLGAAPLGLPAAPGKYIDADPDEFVWIGNDQTVKPRGHDFVLQITEELREVLYLDEAKLVVVDHPPGTEVYPTDKLLPGKPFPPSELVLLKPLLPPVQATRLDGLDVTGPLQQVDGQMVSPVKLRPPQQRGYAEPHGIVLDFGPLPVERPLVLGLTGWLRFGGGMANIAAAIDPDLPFPFPRLEVETASGQWQAVDVAAGAPAGKTKRIMIDLAGKLPAGSKRLRLTAAFEIHWDQAVLLERVDPSLMRISTLRPSRTDLHWRGFSEFEPFPSYLPLTPKYESVRHNPPWRITPAGWCTRYGDVTQLITKRDDALALLNGGDELTLSFDVQQLPPKPSGQQRDFFVYSVGWDKDADFHVAAGTTVEPLPFHGMNDQLYGKEPRPTSPERDAWIHQYNTRWVEPHTLDRDRDRTAKNR